MPEEDYPQGWVELVAISVSGNHEFLSNNPPELLTLPFSMWWGISVKPGQVSRHLNCTVQEPAGGKASNSLT